MFSIKFIGLSLSICVIDRGDPPERTRRDDTLVTIELLGNEGLGEFDRGVFMLDLKPAAKAFPFLKLSLIQFRHGRIAFLHVEGPVAGQVGVISLLAEDR